MKVWYRLECEDENTDETEDNAQSGFHEFIWKIFSDSDDWNAYVVNYRMQPPQ